MPTTKTIGTRRTFLKSSLAAASGVAIRRSDLSAATSANRESRFQVSLHQFSVKPLFDSGELHLREYPRFAKETLGVANIEFAVEFCAALYDDLRQADGVRRQSELAGVQNRVLLCGGDKPLDAANEQDRDDAVRDHLRWAKVAERLGCQFMRVRASSEGDARSQLDHAATGIGAVCDALASSSVSVLIENIAGLSRNPGWLVQLVQRIGRDRVALLADFANFEGDVYEGMRRLLPYTKSVCAKSWDFDAQGNETKIDYDRMMRIIKDSGYRGCISIEYIGQRLSASEGIRKTAALIRRLS